jgi:hypothetical protein
MEREAPTDLPLKSLRPGARKRGPGGGGEGREIALCRKGGGEGRGSGARFNGSRIVFAQKSRSA